MCSPMAPRPRACAIASTAPRWIFRPRTDGRGPFPRAGKLPINPALQIAYAKGGSRWGPSMPDAVLLPPAWFAVDGKVR
jgi:hypothetical protein